MSPGGRVHRYFFCRLASSPILEALGSSVEPKKKKKKDLISSCQIWNEKPPLILSSVVTSVDVVEQLVTQTSSNISAISSSLSLWVPICMHGILTFF